MDAFSHLIKFLREMSLGILCCLAALLLCVMAPFRLLVKLVLKLSNNKKGEENDRFYGRQSHWHN